MCDFNSFNYELTVLCWNMNGVKQKFNDEDAKVLFGNHDLLIIMETFFLKRHKTPDGFLLVGKSDPLCDASRGGVAVYKKCSLDIDFHVYSDLCPDMVVFGAKSLNSVFIAPYVAPENSKYKIKEIFDIIRDLIRYFRNRKVFLVGDLNARCGDPDSIINSYGKKLISICSNSSMVIVNGLKHDGMSFDSNFTFFRGKVKAQNDWCVANCVQNVRSFAICPKMAVSDHCPTSTRLKLPRLLSLEFVESVSEQMLCYDMHDRGRMMKAKLRLNNISTHNLIDRLDSVAEHISEELSSDVDIDDLACVVNEKIYKACSVKKNKKVVVIPEDKKHLTSNNFLAIAKANLNMYVLLIQSQRMDEAEPYFQLWDNYQSYAALKEDEEFNAQVNTSWKFLAKNNPRKMWKRIDYKDVETKAPQHVRKMDENVVRNYFLKVFQSERIASNPTVADVRDSLLNYHIHIPILDDDITLDELNLAIKNNGKGTGIDGLEKSIALLFPLNLRVSIVQMFNRVFSTNYPVEWTRQLLRPEEKKGHTLKAPKLRGVALTQLLPTLYDIILYNRFNLWYIPNFEQAGFRALMGCMLQIFAIYIVMEYLKSLGKTLYVGFLDYEKAFDFINRAKIIQHLREKGAGAKFTKAVASMYEETSYIPKLGNRIGEAITAKHGVTQGRQTSTSLFSFEVQDMGKSIQVASLLREHNLLQLADDSAIMAENRQPILRVAFGQVLEFSDENFMFANLDKTFFLPFSEDGETDPIVIGDSAVIYCAKNKEYIYLGMKYVASNDQTVHIKENLQWRSLNIHKFYEWLHVNDDTPIQTKLEVLGACMFSAYLYGVETWYKIDEVGDDLLLLERKFLKRILGVKSNVPDDLLYLELDCADILTFSKQRQYNFYHNLLKLGEEESVCRKLVSLFHYLPMFDYYRGLRKDAVKRSKTTRIERSKSNTNTLSERYHQLIDLRYNHIVYNSFVPEYLRVVITRWRLSNHDLRIETGRYVRPIIPRNMRFCSVCVESVEDEEHALFYCPLYDDVRRNYTNFLECYSQITEIFNPRTVVDACQLGKLIIDIEKVRKDLNLNIEED